MGVIDNISNSIKSLFSKGDKVKPSQVQTRDNDSHPFAILNDYIPLKVEYDLYKTMREAVPLLDTAVNRIVRLVGKFDIQCEDEREEEEIREFIDNIKVNSNQLGMDAFVESYLDQLIECGNTAAEIVLNNSKDDIYALRNVDIRSIKLKKTENPLINLVCQEQPGAMEPVVLPYQDLILFTPLDPEGDSEYGVSLFRSMPFMANILLRIFQSMDSNWERFGNPRYSVTYRPTNDNMPAPKVKERADMITDSFNDVMNAAKTGDVKDFVGVGDIKIEVIGADNQTLDSEIPVKQVLEQIVAKTGLPPFLLGLSWSTTERMSQQQADFLTSELDNYRDEIEPMIYYVIDKWQLVTGRNIPYEVVWDEINLQDAVENAKAEVYKEQARARQIDNVIKLRDQNIIDQQIAAEELGYEKPVGDKPTFFMPFSGEESSTDEEGTEDKGETIEEKAKKKSCKNTCSCKENQKPDDPVQYSIEQKTIKEYMRNVKKFEEKVLELIPKIQEDNKEKSKEISKDTRDLLDKSVEDFIKGMIGERETAITEYKRYGTHGEYVLYAFEYGLTRANELINDLLDDDYEQQIKPNYNHPYVQEILNNGMNTVVTKAKDMKSEILDVIKEHAAVGDNPVEWARTLENELRGVISEERWYWERLARSESAIAIDSAEMAEYAANDFEYVEWSVAADACEICLDLEGQMWHIDNAPQVVLDTHPHCRCRKLPRTKRQYQEYLGNL